jgi:hypothetical protein
MNTHAYTHTRIHIYMYIEYIHKPIHTYSHMLPHAHTPTHLKYMHTPHRYTHRHKHTCTQIYYWGLFIYTSMHNPYTHIYTYTYTYTYTHTHTHENTNTLPRAPTMHIHELACFICKQRVQALRIA